MGDRVEASTILASLGCLSLVGGCASALGLAGYQIYSDNVRREHFVNTREALESQGLEFWNPTHGHNQHVLNVFTRQHFFEIKDEAKASQSLQFLQRLGYQHIEDHKFKGGLHIVVGSTNQVVFDNLADGIYKIK